MHERLIEHRRHGDCLRKHSCTAGACDAVQPLVPPVVLGNPEPRDSVRRVSELGNFFFERHPGDEIVHPVRNGEIDTFVIGFRRRLLLHLGDDWECGTKCNCEQ